jgi:hypothetical protein
MGLIELYNKIKEQERTKGIKLKYNPYSLSSYVVDTGTGKVLFTGDAISCQVFINNYITPNP